MKRIVITGPSASGKTYLKNKMIEKGFTFSVSYTTRKPRPGEKNGIDYNFLTKKEFEDLINQGYFYEYAKYSNEYYGQGLNEWEKCNIFIMEPFGVNSIIKEDREKTFVMFINTEERTRISRMKERGDDIFEIKKRISHDRAVFKNFLNYDFCVNQSTF
jgi:guanylate kinase